jgi:hypothetical protein
MFVLRLAIVAAASSLFVGCGYLDEDLLVSEETYEESFGIGGIGLSSTGGFGCGGGVGFSRGHSRVAGRSGHATRQPGEGASVIMLEDAFIVGQRPSSPDTAQAPTAPPHRPVDWVGHFDHVSRRRQNRLIGAWIEAQLNGSGQASAKVVDPVDSRREEEVGER